MRVWRLNVQGLFFGIVKNEKQKNLQYAKSAHGIMLVLAGLAVAVLFAEFGVRFFMWLPKTTRDTMVHGAGNVPPNDAYEKASEYWGKYDRFALMRYSSFLG